MRFRNAKSADLAAVENLLATNDLPLDGVRENFSSFVVLKTKGKSRERLASRSLARLLCFARP